MDRNVVYQYFLHACKICATKTVVRHVMVEALRLVDAQIEHRKKTLRPPEHLGLHDGQWHVTVQEQILESLQKDVAEMATTLMYRFPSSERTGQPIGVESFREQLGNKFDQFARWWDLHSKQLPAQYPEKQTLHEWHDHFITFTEET